MDTATPGNLTRDEMESRRLLAAQDLQTGLSQSQVARKFGVSRTTASRWNRSLSGGVGLALKKRRAPGRPSRLTGEQLLPLKELYRAGPRAAGFDVGRWTTARFAEAIMSRFAIRYDPDHAGRIMHRLGLRERRKVRRLAPEVLFTFSNPAGSSPTPSRVSRNRLSWIVGSRGRGVGLASSAPFSIPVPPGASHSICSALVSPQ